MRDKYCGAWRVADSGTQVRVCGWVHSRRDHGGVIFIDLRDHTGLVQVVCEPAQAKAFTSGERLRPEHVIQVHGSVRERPDTTANPNMPTGSIEILAAAITHLNEAVTPPYHPEDINVAEDTQLEHRVIHLRSTAMQRNLRVRHAMTRAVRTALEQHKFIEVETPMLTRSTPEGARDFLVPARNHAGHFYALPQSPQLFKQVLIAGGIDRYCQITRCFRDEDLRANRQPEFTQIDIEMAFVNEQDVMTVATDVAQAAFTAAGWDSFAAIPTLAYADAIRDYATDAPDLSIDLQLIDVRDEVRGCGFQVFAQPAELANNRVAALRAPSGDKLSRKDINDLTDFVRKLGAAGLAYLKVHTPRTGCAGVSSPIAKFLADELVDAIVAKCKAQAGDIIFFGAGPAHVVNGYLAPLRVKLGQQLKLVRTGNYPVWITDFPLFVCDPDSSTLLCPHHPFTAPTAEDEQRLLAGDDPLTLRSRAYDLVLNGVEIGGGSIRIHQAKTQLAALAVLGIDQATARDKFGFLLSTLAQGAPPHGGIAFGLDRMVAMALGLASIREVIAFPKTQRGQCLFTAAPQPVPSSQLAELGLTLRQNAKQTT